MRIGSKQSNSHTAVRVALKRALDAGADETVVFHLRKPKAPQPPTAEETEHMANAVIESAVKHCGYQPKRKTVFQNLGSMAVQAGGDLLLKILDQPEVQSASLNRPQGGEIELIRPVRKAPAKSKGWVAMKD